MKTYWYVDSEGIIQCTNDLDWSLDYEVHPEVEYDSLWIFVEQTGEVIDEYVAYSSLQDVIDALAT